jgi:hypothetical protein
MGSEIRFVNEEKVAVADGRSSFPRNFVTLRHVNDVHKGVDEFR